MSSYYRVEVKRANPLSIEEEADMFSAYRKRRTAKRREEIVRQYLYWASELACRYCGPRMPREDAISAANLGLMQAIEDFDPARGHRFVTHSYFAIRRSVLTALRETYIVNPASGINVARHQFNLSAKTAADEKKFLVAKREVFDSAGITIPTDTLDAARGYSDSPRLDGELDPLPHDGEERDSVEDDSMKHALRGKIAEMPTLERKIFTLRYLSEDTPRFCDIGKKLGMSEDHCRYKHNRMLGKLKTALMKERHLP